MSRLIVFDLDNHGMGGFTANCNRGWMLYGHPNVSGAGTTDVEISAAVARQKWLQLGRMVHIAHPKLPPWTGVIDTPWKATLPVQLSLYNAEYLFSMRSPEQVVKYVGSVPYIVGEMIRKMNEQEKLYLSMGTVTGSGLTREEVVDGRTYWDQLVPLLERSGFEMVLRSERGDGKRLKLYADIGVQLGEDTGLQLTDGGARPNMKVLDAVVDGKIVNRVRGRSGSSTAEDQLETDILEDQTSQSIYRTRSLNVQFRDVTQLSLLTGYTQTYLDNASEPYITLTVDAFDVGDTFFALRPGNRAFLRTSKLYLMGGVRSWKGIVRILVMAYDEAKNSVRMKLQGRL